MRDRAGDQAQKLTSAKSEIVPHCCSTSTQQFAVALTNVSFRLSAFVESPPRPAFSRSKIWELDAARITSRWPVGGNPPFHKIAQLACHMEADWRTMPLTRKTG